MIRTIAHKALRALGFDIVSHRNLEAELARRDELRQRAKVQAIQDLRLQQKSNILTQTGELTWVSRGHLTAEAVKHMREAEVVLDIGCAFRPQQYIEANVHICCEPFHEYMDRLLVETSGESKYVYLNADLTAASQLLPEASVDSVFMTDVIEHVDRETGLLGLERLKRIARNQIVVFTPLGFMGQEPGEDDVDPWGMGGMEWQKHHSGWTPEDFPATEGWTVVACKDFHQVDAYKRSVKQPFGALWAFWNARRPQ